MSSCLTRGSGGQATGGNASETLIGRERERVTTNGAYGFSATASSNSSRLPPSRRHEMALRSHGRSQYSRASLGVCFVARSSSPLSVVFHRSDRLFSHVGRPRTFAINSVRESVPPDARDGRLIRRVPLPPNCLSLSLALAVAPRGGRSINGGGIRWTCVVRTYPYMCQCAWQCVVYTDVVGVVIIDDVESRESLESLSSSSVAISPSLNVFLSLRDPLSQFLRVLLSSRDFLTLPYPYPYPILSRAPKSEYYAPLPCVYDRCVLLSAVSLSSHLHSYRGQVSRGSSGGEPTPVWFLWYNVGPNCASTLLPESCRENEPSTARVVVVDDYQSTYMSHTYLYVIAQISRRRSCSLCPLCVCENARGKKIFTRT